MTRILIADDDPDICKCYPNEDTDGSNIVDANFNATLLALETSTEKDQAPRREGDELLSVLV